MPYAPNWRTVYNSMKKILLPPFESESVLLGEKEQPYGQDYTIDEMRKIKTTQPSFSGLIGGDYLYVDKTRAIHDLLTKEEDFYFLSRPRRYGKSLFCSTLHALFDGKRELFKGLYIAEKTDYSFEPFPVLHFDFSGMDTDTRRNFLSSFREQIRDEARRNGLEIEDSTPARMLKRLIDAIYERDGKVVIIIDEFDSPMTGAMDKEFIGSIRDVFSAFYAVIKMNAPRIRFLFITGVVKLSNLSIFSRMNNLIDLSMNPHFAAAFGYTDDELMEHFGDGMDEYCETHPDEYASRNEFASRIREYYDGYRFCPESPGIYNPFSILCTFRKKRFGNYWFQTGTPTYLVGLLKKSDYDLEELSHIQTDADTLDCIFSDENPVPVIYQSGYLTIKQYDSEFGIYTLGFPNREVEEGFMRFLMPYFSSSTRNIDKWMVK